MNLFFWKKHATTVADEAKKASLAAIAGHEMSVTREYTDLLNRTLDEASRGERRSRFLLYGLANNVHELADCFRKDGFRVEYVSNGLEVRW